MLELQFQHARPIADSLQNLPQSRIVRRFGLCPLMDLWVVFEQGSHLPQFGFPLREHFRAWNQLTALDFMKHVFGALANFQRRFLLGRP